MPSVKFPINVNLESIDGAVDRAKIVNGYAEVANAQEVKVYSRPALTLETGDFAAFGQGMFYSAGTSLLYYVDNNTLYSFNGTTSVFRGFVDTPDNPTHSLTAGTFGADVGFVTGLYGTFTPSTLNGQIIVAISDDNDAGPDFVVQIGSSDLGQSFFTSMYINGTTRLTSAATYSFAGQSQWSWSGAVGLVNATVYPVTFIL